MSARTAIKVYDSDGNDVPIKRAEQPRIKFARPDYRWEHQSGVIDGHLVAFHQEMSRGRRVYFQFPGELSWFSLDATTYPIRTSTFTFTTRWRGEAPNDVQEARASDLPVTGA